MPTYPLDYRIKDFLKRQIVWSRAVLEELEAFCAAGDDADFGPYLDQQQRRERETEAMQKEYRGLAREWEAAGDVSPEDRAEIEGLSREAETLAEALRTSYRRAEKRAAALSLVNRKAMNDLRRGRRSVNIYRPGAVVRPGFVDRKA